MYSPGTLSINLFRKSFYSSLFCHVDFALTMFLQPPMYCRQLLYLQRRMMSWTQRQRYYALRSVKTQREREREESRFSFTLFKHYKYASAVIFLSFRGQQSQSTILKKSNQTAFTKVIFLIQHLILIKHMLSIFTSKPHEKHRRSVHNHLPKLYIRV